jgi:hypothetical protein
MYPSEKRPAPHAATATRERQKGLFSDGDDDEGGEEGGASAGEGGRGAGPDIVAVFI